MDDDYFKLNLKYSPPTLEEAELWASQGNKNVSGFACFYPGRYTEAAELARKVLRIADEGIEEASSDEVENNSE